MFFHHLDEQTIIISIMPTRIYSPEKMSRGDVADRLVEFFDAREIIHWCDEQNISYGIFLERLPVNLSQEAAVDEEDRLMYKDSWCLILVFEHASDLTHMKLVLG